MHGRDVLAIVAMVCRRIAQHRVQQLHQLLLPDRCDQPTKLAPN
jgi:hypothetical protein